MNLRKRIISISLQELRSDNNEIAYKKLINVKDFDKIIVNALNSYDLKVFVTLINKAMEQNKRFIFRTAASFVNEISGVPAKKAAIKSNSRKKGLFVVGSHTELTTKQIGNLINSGVVGVKLDISMVFSKRAKQKERTFFAI